MLSRSFARLAPLSMLIALALLARGATPAQGASFTVNATHDAVDASPGDGVCADATGACTLRAAVIETNALAGADEISVPAGTYVLSIPGAGEDASATGDLDIADDLTLLGAGSVSTLVDGGGLDRVLHVLSGGSVVVSGVFVGNGSALMGGGISNEGSVSLTSSIVRANQAFASPGCPGICAAGNGGGVANLGSIELVDVEISDNRSDVGGGIMNDGSALLTRSSLTDNTATSEGGAVSNFDTVSITDSSISGNAAGSTGGAIDNNAGDVTVIGSTFDRNQADYGGALYNQAASELINVTISGNSAAINGGGILNVGSNNTVTTTNITITDNSSPLGGGIYNGSVDGIGEAGLMSLVNTIIAFNQPDGDCSGPITSAGHNANVDGTCGLGGTGDTTGGELRIEALADNGGPTQTHALSRPGCPSDVCISNVAVDGGDDSRCPPTDQRGQTRPFDGDGNGFASCDIGAFELREEPLTCEPGSCGVTFITPSPTPVPTAITSATPLVPIALPRTGGSTSPNAMPLAALVASSALALGTALAHRFARRVFTHR